MPDLFTLPELATYLPETATDPDRAALLVDLTLGLIYGVVPAADADGNPTARAIGLEVAARAWRNSDGYSSETIDDYTYRKEAGTRAPGVYLTADERASLRALDTASPVVSRVRSVRLRSASGPWDVYEP